MDIFPCVIIIAPCSRLMMGQAMEADAHPRQADRLKALYSYDILDTDREREFDEVVALAAAICGTAISVVNLIDADRQWFKAEVGLGVRETPLATSLCSHVILQDGFTEISDTQTDPRMRDNPLCMGVKGLRFYAGALLQSDDGMPIGTLCVLDHQPRVLSPMQRDALRVLARLVMTQLDLRRALKSEELLRKEVDHRVKNSLQSVAGLLRLKARNAQTKEARNALELAQRRIASVADIHDMLSQADASGHVDLGQFVERFRDHVKGSQPEYITLTAQVSSILVSSRIASNLGIIINEFLANAFKHAFADDQPGTITLRLDRLDTGKARLVCEDDGKGADEEIPAASGAGGLGTQIIDAVAAQIGAEIERRSDATGTGLTLTFALE
ncbi:MAG: histidine kinase dimerization/phosphoacceptor domain -containing protein [Albidovulum sp.]